MSLSLETLRQMTSDMGGPELSDDRLEQVLAQVRINQAHGEKLRQLDLSKVLPARLMRAEARGEES